MTVYGGGAVYGDGTVYGGQAVTAPPPPPVQADPWLQDRYVWLPAEPGPPITMWRSTPPAPFSGFTIRRDRGFSELRRELTSSRPPARWGSRVRSSGVLSRELLVEVVVWSEGLADHRRRVADLANAFATPPTPPGRHPRPGKLQIVRHGMPDLEIEAHPTGDTPHLVEAHEHLPDGVVAAVYEVVLEAPDPRFREVEPAGVAVLGEANAGFHFPLVFPLVLPSRNDRATVVNDGIAAPLFIELAGEMVGATVALVDPAGNTVEQITVDGTIEAGDTLVIANGNVVLRHPDGSEEDGWPLLDGDSDPFELPRGTYELQLTADTIDGGRARIVWHRHHAAAA